jgi:hypothetical protein
VNVSKLAGNQNETADAINPLNPNRVFAVSNTETSPTNPPTGLMASVSTDGGATWTSRIMADGSDGLPVACCDPQPVFDKFGNLFLVYLQTTGTPQVVVALSTNGGQSFSTLTTLAVGSPDQPSVAVGANSVWVDFSDGTGVSVAGASVTGLNQIGTFSPVTRLPGSTVSGGGNLGDIAVGPTGQVMVIYQAGPGIGVNQILENVNPTGLANPSNFGAATLITNTNVGGADTNIPAQSNNFGIDAEASLAWDASGGAFNGRVYMVYADAPSTTSSATNIFIRFSDNNGGTWSSPTSVTDDPGTNSKFNQSVVVDQSTGKVGIQWYDCRNDLGNHGPGDTNGIANDDAQLWGTILGPGGVVQGPNFQISQGTSNSAASEPPDFAGFRPLGYGDFQKCAAFADGIFIPVWADNSNSTGDNPNGALTKLDVYTARIQAGLINPARGTFFTDGINQLWFFNAETGLSTNTGAFALSFSAGLDAFGNPEAFFTDGNNQIWRDDNGALTELNAFATRIAAGRGMLAFTDGGNQLFTYSDATGQVTNSGAFATRLAGGFDFNGISQFAFLDGANGLWTLSGTGAVTNAGHTANQITVGNDVAGNAEAWFTDANNQVWRFDQGALTQTGTFATRLAGSNLGQLFYTDGANNLLVIQDGQLGGTYLSLGHAFGTAVSSSPAFSGLFFLDGANQIWMFSGGVFTPTGAFATRLSAF